MKGKIGLVVGLGVGYVLGTRAGQERYEQLKTQWQKVWNTDQVQDQVDKVKGFVGDKAAAVPGVLWTGAVKVVKSVTGEGSAGEKLDAVISSGKEAAEDVSEATEDAVEEAKSRNAGPAGAGATTASVTSKKPAPKKPGV
ncbi:MULTISPECIES: hypothetical protein [unclassified Microbacterium]|uniref:hypothetical protein n=1 Tax=unclassified Microbacterium TaxID=2609290 RepID=UPI000EAA87E5|nr:MULTISPECIES: hypothetical protein [unclassified Microbacterium]MBT2483732.1 hypothetical protein [Microbacterium sp. ISL-108]RKN66724.1 hypothetical protein D7252_03365 [Microbacterium sp. CGR2]